ncbi:MAG: hypothetical protein JO057_13120 [Chloroflexi bacterium]|nr:hypothetical protein [Chloroflexota bacterium]
MSSTPTPTHAEGYANLDEEWDFKRTRAEVCGHTAAFHPRLREWVVAIRDLVANATLSTGENRLLRELADEIHAASG